MSDVEEKGDCGRRCDEARPMTALSSDEDGRSGGMRFDAIEVEEMAARPNSQTTITSRPLDGCHSPASLSLISFLVAITGETGSSSKGTDGSFLRLPLSEVTSLCESEKSPGVMGVCERNTVP